MKVAKIVGVIIVFVVGYAVGNFFPFSGFGKNAGSEGGIGIKGSAKLEVTILDSSSKPVTNLEVDVAEKPGPPLPGGDSLTNQDGVATFNIKPGNYVIFFNSGNFPQNLQESEIQPIQVVEGSVNKKTITLKSK